MKTSRWIKYDAPSGLWIQSNKRIYLYWYSFLQHAERDPTRTVDWTKYDGWGDANEVLTTKFDNWWRTHWENLFGIPKEGDEPKFPLSTKRPKEQGLRYALLVYERRDVKDNWSIAMDIAKREWRDRKKGLTSGAFDNAVKKDWIKQDEPTRRKWKRIAQSRVGRIRYRAEVHLDNVCRGIFP